MKIDLDTSEEAWVELLKTGEYIISRTRNGAVVGNIKVYLRRRKGSSMPKISHIFTIELPEREAVEFIIRLKSKLEVYKNV